MHHFAARLDFQPTCEACSYLFFARPRAGGSGARRSATVRAASEAVRVAVVPYAAAKHFLRAHPLAKQRLAEASWARHSEAVVLEALLRLASIRDDLAAAVAANPRPQPTP